MTDEQQQVHEQRDGDERDQLDPVRTPHTNSVLRGPTPDIGDLVCELALDPRSKSVVTVSAWEPDERQRELIAAGAHLRMSVWQHPIPPLALAIEAPFCAACGAEKVYVKAERAFFCATGDCSMRDQRFGGAQTNGTRTALEEAHDDFSSGGEVPPPNDDGPG